MSIRERYASAGATAAGRMQEPLMVICIDFGTTYSGVSWAWSGNSKDIHNVQGWEGDGGSAKVPTKIQYEGDTPIAWGFAAEDTPTTFTWFKLILDYENLPRSVRDCGRVSSTHTSLSNWSLFGGNIDKAAIKVTTDYLTLLWRHAVSEIVKNRGQTWTKGMPCKVSITRPAIWSQKATANTEQAAKSAILSDFKPFGSVSISLVSEPEAAAHAVLQAPEVADRLDVTKVNDMYVVCDAGGGTVDVISYQVQSLDPLKLRECIEGEGDLCGAIFVDDDFEQFLKLHVGTRSWATLDRGVLDRLMKYQWEHHIKRAFDLKRASRKWVIDIAGVGIFPFSCDQIETLFQPVCSRVRSLIREQVDQIWTRYGTKPKAIVLVGGLGSSKYLGDVLSTEYGSEIEVQYSPNNDTWSAVCRGAVLATLEHAIVSRVCRLNYGIAFNTPFDNTSREHRALTKSHRQWDHTHQAWVMKGKMHWIVRRGAQISQISPGPLHPAEMYIQDPGQLTTGTISIWVCDDLEPPEWRSSSVKLLCNIVVTLDMTFAQLPEYLNGRQEPYRIVRIDVTMSPDGNTLEFDVSYDNRRLRKELRFPDSRGSGRNVVLELERTT